MNRFVAALLSLVALGAAQQVIWTKGFAYTGADVRVDVAVDSGDNIIFAADSWVRKYDPEGKLLWEKQVGPPVSYTALCVAVDSQDNFLVGGNASDSTWFVRKLGPAGESIWTKNWHQSMALLDLGTSGDHILIAGGIGGPPDYGWYFLELSPAGDSEWSRWLPSGPFLHAQSTSICAGLPPNVIVSGWYEVPSPFAYYPKFLRYSRSGDSLGAATYCPDSGSEAFYVTQVATDRSGDVFITGVVDKSSPPCGCAFLLKFDSNATLRWARLGDSALSSWSCRADSFGYIYTAGSGMAPGRVSAIQLRCFSPNGDSVWTWFYPLNASGYTAMDLDHNGNLVFADFTQKGSNDSAYLVKVALPPVGITERPNRGQREVEAPSTVVNLAELGRSLSSREEQVLYDMRGRRLGRWRDLGSLTAGVYFLRRGAGSRVNIRKLILVR